MNLTDIDKNSRTLKNVVAVLSQALGAELQRVGGVRRLYNVGGQVGAAFIVKGTTHGLGFTWTPSGLDVASIYFWRQFSIGRVADLVIDLPPVGKFSLMAPTVVSMLKSPRTGPVEVPQPQMAAESVLSEDVLPREFGHMVAAEFGPDITALTKADLDKVASDNNVIVPQSILNDPKLKNGGVYDLSPMINRNQLQAQGQKVQDGVPPKAGFDDLVNIAKAKSVRQLATQGKIVLMGRAPDGTLFEIPGLEDFAASIERLVTKQVEAGIGQGKQQSMEEQIKLVQDRARIIASGKTSFVKSLLVVGAPSSGKTFNIMTTIKALGMQPGKDYVIKKGKTTAVSMYRTLIEQIDGLTIFDDCDSVMEDSNGVNMLKGALDTDPVRSLSYDVQGTTNTGAMSEEDRTDFVNAFSRVLRGEPTEADMARFAYMLKRNKGKGGGAAPQEAKPKRTWRSVAAERGEDISGEAHLYDIDAEIGDDKPTIDPGDLAELQAVMVRRMPNNIDYRGRIIFISNMKKEDWNDAILTRTFYVNMQFSSGEMLDYIEKIQGSLKAENLTPEMKQETIDFIRELYVMGKFKTQINFRIIQQAFDLRLLDDWKKLVAVI